MPPRVEFSPEAAEELMSAASFYEAHRSGLALRFIVAVEHVVSVVADQPLTGTLLDGLIRRHLVPGFPYAVIYETQGERIRVLAIAHSRRRPGYWHDQHKTNRHGQEGTGD